MSCRIVSYDREDEQNYFRLNDIPIISTADAAFLYREKRIEKFIVFDPNEAEKQMIAVAINQIGIKQDDIIALVKINK